MAQSRQSYTTSNCSSCLSDNLKCTQPILIITSNSEKNLPEPFLRRCVYYHIPFPKDDLTLLNIVKQQINHRNKLSNKTLQTLIAEFLKIRDIAEKRNAKVPATAELISWISILADMKFDLKDLQNPNSLLLQSSFAVLAKDENFRRDLVDRYRRDNS